LEERLRVVRGPSQVQISAFVARQKVNVLMLEQVSNLLLAGDMSDVLSLPHFQQSAEGYCLPACVRMVLAAWAEFGYRGAYISVGTWVSS